MKGEVIQGNRRESGYRRKGGGRGEGSPSLMRIVNTSLLFTNIVFFFFLHVNSSLAICKS